jgi:hypothetical protein
MEPVVTGAYLDQYYNNFSLDSSMYSPADATFKPKDDNFWEQSIFPTDTNNPRFICLR